MPCDRLPTQPFDFRRWVEVLGGAAEAFLYPARYERYNKERIIEIEQRLRRHRTEPVVSFCGFYGKTDPDGRAYAVNVAFTNDQIVAATKGLRKVICKVGWHTRHGRLLMPGRDEQGRVILLPVEQAFNKGYEILVALDIIARLKGGTR